jgi:hypothetical protein
MLWQRHFSIYYKRYALPLSSCEGKAFFVLVGGMMSNLSDFAQLLRQMQLKEVSGYEIGTVVKLTPFTVSLYGGSMMAADPLLKLTETAAAKDWRTGNQALCLMQPSGVVLVDRM